MVGLEDLSKLKDPAIYARARLAMDLYPWQERVLRAIEPRGARVALRTCNEAGKTSTVATAMILWHMETFVNSMTVTTSGAYRQIKNQLYPHLQSWGGRLGKHFEFGDGWGINHATGSALVSFSTDNPGKAEGWHEPPRMPGEILGTHNPLEAQGVSWEEWAWMAGKVQKTSLMLIMDEAKTPPIELHEAFERCHATRWINLSSPGASFGPFYDCFNKHKARWNTFRASAMDCPHLWDDPAKRAELEEQITHLRPELVQSMIYAEFMPESDGMIFDMQRVSESMTGRLARWGEGRYRKAAFDTSGGGDEQLLAMCDGNRAWIEWAGFEKDHHKLVDLVIGRLKKWGIPPDDCIADDGGLGKVHMDEFELKGYPLRRFLFNDPARNKEIYRNARAEAYFGLADKLRLGHIILPDDETLKEELAFARYETDSMPLKLVEKKKLPRSPNRSDAIAMLFWNLPDPRELRPDRGDGAEYSPTRMVKNREEYAASTFDD
jgi:hypothetical protein